ncbi:MAG TPA: TolC family protein [Blastocatellia bacterium]|nr:TolC family protein [Blastocatellia bacterium]
MSKRRVAIVTVAAALLAGLAQGALAQSTSEQLGLVLSGKRPAAAELASAASMHQQYIDPVDGLGPYDLVRYALAHNGELGAARQMIGEARGRLRQAGLRANPMLEASGSQAVNASDNNQTFGAELPLELGGRRGARITVAERELQLRQAEVADFERRLAAEVRSKYAAAIAATRNLKFIEELLTLTRDSHRIVQARVEHGKTAPLEQNLLRVEVSRVDSMRISFESRTDVSVLELKRVIGMPPNEPLRLRGEFGVEQQPAPVGDAIRNALAKRADLVAARAAEALAAAQVEQARRDGRLDASIFANYMRQSMGFDVQGFNSAGALAPVQGIFHYATFGIRLTLPVRNKNEGLIEAAVAGADAARTRREFAEIVVRNEVSSAYARFEHARAALAVYRDSVREQALRNLEVIHQTYVLGQKSVLDYLGEQRRFIEVETGYTEVLKELFESLVEIERVAGSATAV